MRTMAVWCPDWPVVAAGRDGGHPDHAPAAVFSANRVFACNAQAREHGVLRGMRRRQAQAHCPELLVLPADADRDARRFEPVVTAVEELAPGVEVVRPGVIALPASGPARYFGGEHRCAEQLVDHIAASTRAESQIGIADGLFAAVLAARRGAVVEQGRSAAFLAGLNIAELRCTQGAPDAARGDLVDLLRRLGLRSIGQFAELPERAVASRFGTDAVLAHRQARGLEQQPLARRRPHRELTVSEPFDPPVDRVDTAAFAARALAERLHEVLAAHGSACFRLGIHATTEHGEEHYRVWRCADPLSSTSSASAIADRVRWQLEGWLSRSTGHPSAGLIELRLEPEEVITGSALQAELWSANATDEKAGRALVHVQALLGPEKVCTAVLRGGRGPSERIRLVPWGDTREEPAPAAPWPGRLPEPNPVVVFPQPAAASVRDADGNEVGVSARGMLSAAPARVLTRSSAPADVLGWAGPWPVASRWWEPGGGHSLARMQVLLTEPSSGEQSALLLAAGNGHWFVEGHY